MLEIDYGIAIHEPGTNQAYHENSHADFETMSGIKSVLGTLALEQAARQDVDIDAYSLSVGLQHSSNGSGELKYLLDKSNPTLALSLRSVVEHNTALSDCVATNALIDYLGGMNAINQGIESTFGLDGIKLVADNLQFPGVDHTQQPFQVGKGTMADFVRYYEAIWSPGSVWSPLSGEHAWHQGMHTRVKAARLLGVPQQDLPAGVEWLHKTGSGTDVQPNYFYMTFMDAGVLRVAGRMIFVAAASTVQQDAQPTPSTDIIEQDFALRNEVALSTIGVTIPSKERTLSQQA